MSITHGLNLAKYLPDINNLISKAAVYAIDKPAPFLRNTIAGIYFISTLAHSSGLALNKEIPAKEKKFLIPQELMNGALSLITFLTVATSLEGLGRKLVDKGIIVGSEVAKANPAFRKGVAMLFSIVGTVIAFNIITPLLRNPLAHLIQSKLKQKVTPEHILLTQPAIPGLKVNQLQNNNPFNSFEKTLKTGKLPVKSYYNSLNASQVRGSLKI